MFYPTANYAFLICALLPVAVRAATIEETFKPGSNAEAWKLEFQTPEKSSLQFPAAGNPAGLMFESRGIAKLQREVAPVQGTFELMTDIEFSRGAVERWRNNGIAISFSSAPVDKMENNDWCVLFESVQQGVISTVMKGGARWGVIRPNDARDVSELQGNDIAPRFALTTSGAGGDYFSVRWPATSFADVKLRFHAWRDEKGEIRLSVYHNQASAGPWWESSATLPAGLRDVPLKYLTVFVSQESEVFRDPDKANLTTAEKRSGDRAKSLFAGRIEAIRLLELQNGQPQWNKPFPATPIVGKPRPSGIASAWLPKGGVAAIRAKFNDPRFVDYKSVFLRLANPKEQENVESFNQWDTHAQIWAYVLTGEKVYLERAISKLREQMSVTDALPKNVAGSPGHLRQALDVKEFQVHRFEAAALAYDLLYDELPEDLRDSIHRGLLRAIDHYLERLKAKDWWYSNNPSNTIGVGNAGSGLIALALRHEHPELCKKVIDLAVPLIKNQYVGVADDGGCLEGNMYWNYGMSYPLMLGYLLQNIEGTDRGLLDSSRVKNAQHYIENILGGDGKMIPFNDTQPWLSGWLICSLAGSRFDQPLMRWMTDHMAHEFATGKTYPEQDRGPFTAAAFLFRDDKPAPAEFPGVPTLSVLHSIEEAVLRSDGGFIPRMVVGVKGNGQENTHHANQDQGSFVLYAKGEMLLIDPGYFDGGANCHSLPIIGDTSDFKLNHRANVPLRDVWEAGSVRSIRVDSTAAYASDGKDSVSSAKKVNRVVVAVGDQALIVLDDIVPNNSEDAITSQLQAGFAASVIEGKSPAAVIQGAKGALLARWFGPTVSVSVAPRKFKKDWVFAKSGVTWQTINAVYKTDPNAPMVTVLTPTTSAAERVKVDVLRGPDAITVKLPGGESVTFTKIDTGWVAQKPK